MIKLDYKSGKPIHEQITQGIKELVINGALKKDEQLPSVRELSVSLTVNPNTVQRSYRTLEAEGIIYSVRGKGNFVSDVIKADQKQIDTLYEALTENLKELRFWGESKENIYTILNKVYEERNEEDD